MKRTLIKTGAVLVISALFVGIFSVFFIIYASKNIDYSTDELLFNKVKNNTAASYYAYNKSGDLKEVYKNLSKGKREWTSLEDAGHYLKNGFISMEDRLFYEHKGINVKRTLAAAANHILKLADSFGASTITQQVIKNISGDNEVSVKRKFNEIFRALHLERNHSKDEILELYLNIAPMSENMYGIGIASERYFNKEPNELTAAEAATIVGITNAPTKYNPYLYPEACIEKRNRVLGAMYECSVISLDEYNEAISTSLSLSDSPLNAGSSWFAETAHEDIIADIVMEYGISRAAADLMLNGSRIILTMSPEIQEVLDDFFSVESNFPDKVKEGLNYAMVVSDPYTGNLLGIVGNACKAGSRLYNYATSPIIPGSVIKPISLYAPLIDSGEICWSTQLEDAPLKYSVVNGEEVPYPKNSPEIYEGMIDINDALKRSKNTIALRLYRMLGVEAVFNHLKYDFGFNLIKNDELNKVSDYAEAPLALGQLSYGIPLRTLTEAYNVFPAGGILNLGRSYYCVLDRDGAEIISATVGRKRVYKKETAEIMNQLLMNVVNDGTARSISLKESVDTAGKTGTSSKDRDRLFIGYTPYYTAGIWCGFSSDGKSVGNNTPSHLQIWDRVMKRIHEITVFDDHKDNFECFDTSSLTVQPYCKMSGLIPNENCELDDENTISYGYFSKYGLLQDYCNRH